MLELGLDALVLTLSVPPFSWFNSLSTVYRMPTNMVGALHCSTSLPGGRGGGAAMPQEYQQK